MIHRDDHNDSFTMIRNDVLNDKNLSFEAKGFLVYLLSFTDEWEFSINGLAYTTGLTRNTIMRLVKELKKAGYIHQKKKQNKKGQFTSYEWDIYELPEVNENRTSVNAELGENRTTATPKYGERRPITSTNNKQVPNITSTNSKEKSIKEKRFVPPTVEEVKAYCETRGNSVDPEAFVAFYQSKGWKVGKNPMKDWKAAVITWEKHDKRPTKARPEKFPDENPFTALRREEGFI